MLVLVSYDVATAVPGGQRRLHRVAKACQNYGQRVQYSVFECIVVPAQWAALRKKLIDENRLDGVVSMPSGAFRPYAGVSTAIVLFTRGARTDRIWFYDMEHDGFSLDDKRLPVAENDIPDVLSCWQHRHDSAFETQRQTRLAELKGQAEPLKARRLELQGEINRLTFESAIAPEGDGEIGVALAAAQRELAELQAKISPLQSEINQLGRQFWVTKVQVRANKYDLSASRYGLI